MLGPHKGYLSKQLLRRSELGSDTFTDLRVPIEPDCIIDRLVGETLVI